MSLHHRCSTWTAIVCRPVEGILKPLVAHLQQAGQLARADEAFYRMNVSKGSCISQFKTFWCASLRSEEQLPYANQHALACSNPIAHIAACWCVACSCTGAGLSKACSRLHAERPCTKLRQWSRAACTSVQSAAFVRLQEEGVPGGFGKRHPAASPSKAAVLGSTADERCAQTPCTGCLLCTQNAWQYAACPQC